ncbi:MAG: biotin--[acetyl-CoA-carboxylase] ligase [Actinomycetota bacterium]|jgi:BirA family biotin operon repressor/biotin-[acetyl-CoA-carboxylase] ligase|nr:biotin--[acetyl-CoA-carboxylase] ligase [Actinomycetota bacterium]
MTAVTWDVRRFTTLESTNDWLLRRAREGAPAGLVALADHQRAGRGRMGRRWEAPPGRCLLVSVLLRPVAPPGALFACTAAVALAAADACAAVAGVEPTVKWPNDLLIGERKVAGVLAESDASAQGGRPGSVAVVVGIGVNLDWEGPPGADATSLAAYASGPVGREPLLEVMLDELSGRAAMLDTDEARRAIVAELRARCATLGRQVAVEMAGGRRLLGTASALGDDGRLVVATAEGDVAVSAGDVVHLRPAAGEPE